MEFYGKAHGADVKRVWNLIVFTIAILYFLMDAIFATVAIPLSRWIAAHWVFERIHRWVLSLGPYPTLALFALPLIILEPVKPVAAYLVGTGHFVPGFAVLAIGEILKLILVERLFSVSRDKLLSIPAFAWAYRKYSAVKERLTSLEAWQLVLRWSRIARYAVHRYAPEQPDSLRSHDAYLPLTTTVARRQRN
ncbi:hypothetical protein [Bradyrhizobium canariense]|uniref:Transmembrane protein n=1 Tax=Bradyrhizobium canariense TaxID=255045 RepID=A0A1H1WM36_9BRAD|nr:hypothetical protein [Bradyrhizobium canariense]SDS98125.1 hypothetical protein SAMN05444158_3915 [Bradyrhizobium canariense]